MPGQTRPVSDERDGLMAFLEQARYQLKLTGTGSPRSSSVLRRAPANSASVA
jgi:hypothetical protein